MIEIFRLTRKKTIVFFFKVNISGVVFNIS